LTLIILSTLKGLNLCRKNVEILTSSVPAFLDPLYEKYSNSKGHMRKHQRSLLPRQDISLTFDAA